jgi:hypothetical protein
LQCSQSDDCSKNNFAKFGYMPNMKMKILKNASIFFTSYWNFSLKYWDIFPLQFGDLGQFFHERSFV